MDLFIEDCVIYHQDFVVLDCNVLFNKLQLFFNKYCSIVNDKSLKQTINTIYLLFILYGMDNKHIIH